MELKEAKKQFYLELQKKKERITELNLSIDDCKQFCKEEKNKISLATAGIAGCSAVMLASFPFSYFIAANFILSGIMQSVALGAILGVALTVGGWSIYGLNEKIKDVKFNYNIFDEHLKKDTLERDALKEEVNILEKMNLLEMKKYVEVLEDKDALKANLYFTDKKQKAEVLKIPLKDKEKES